MEQKDLKILICDDSLLVRKKMKELMLQNGYDSIFEAKDGQAAVDTYKIVKPQITFMDIVMPIKSGVDALKEIIGFDASARVIMASSLGTQGNLKEAITAGAYDFLQKPIEDAQLLAMLKDALKEDKD